VEEFPGKYIAIFHFQDHKINPWIPLGSINPLGAGLATEYSSCLAFAVINHCPENIGIEGNRNLVSSRVGIDCKGKWPAFPVYPEYTGI